MRVNFYVMGQERKDLVNAISEIMGIAPVYAGAGGNVIHGERHRFSYVVMNITINKHGEVIWDERTDDDTINKVFDGLKARGYHIEQPLDEEQIAEFSAEISAEAGGDPRFAEAQRRCTLLSAHTASTETQNGGIVLIPAIAMTDSTAERRNRYE